MMELASDRRRITLHAVAKRAGVSAMTVSNVINRTGRVSDATRDRVLSAVAELNYTPNLAARHLSADVLSRVGLIYPGVESVFIQTTVAAIAAIVAGQGIQLQTKVVPRLTPEATQAVARSLAKSGVQGLLLLPPFAEMLGKFAQPPVPAVAIATASALPYVSTVRIDNRAASRTMTERLLASGRSRVAVLAGPSNHSDSSARLDGYRDALAARGIAIDPALYEQGDFTFQSGLEGARRLLNQTIRPDAIVAANDDMAAAVLWMAHQLGLQLPNDVAVGGFDDTLLATRVWPPLTTIRQPIEEMAETAVERLARSVRDPENAIVPCDVVLPFTLIGRQSG